MFNAIVASLKPQLLQFKSKNAFDISVKGLSESSFKNIRWDLDPFEGKVVLITDKAIVVRVKANTFMAVDRSLVTTIPAMGNKVKVIPYVRRRFTGENVRDIHNADTQYMDGEFFSINSHDPSDCRARIPGPKVTDPDMLEFIRCLQDQHLPDEYRAITHLMVDAGAKDITLHEPDNSEEEAKVGISFDVATAKFTGKIFIYYHPYPENNFTVTFFDIKTEEFQAFEKISGFDLGKKLNEQFDGDSFKKIHIEVI